MSVSLLRLRNGEIALFYLKINSQSDCIPLMRISSDEAKTWSEPTRCIHKEGYFNLNNNRIIQLKNGRLLMPVSLHEVPGGKWVPRSQRGHIYNYFSDDNGRSWKSGVEIANPDSVILQEPGVLELKNGDVFMFMRTMSGVQYFSYSKDKGETWSAVEPGNLKSSCSPASIVRIPSTGDLLAVWNNVADARTPLTVAISKDEGKTWEKIKNVEDDPRGSFCYTAIHFTGKDVLLGYGAFYWTSSKGGLIIKKINIDWIYK
jgi:sialidase-1